MGLFSNIWKAIVKVVKQIWDAIRPLIAICFIIIAVFYPFLIPFLQGLAIFSVGGSMAWMAASLVTLGEIGWTMCAIWSVGVAYLVDSETASEVVSQVGEAAADVASVVVDVAGSVGGDVVRNLLENPYLLLGVGVAAYFLFFSGGSDENKNDGDFTDEEKLLLEEGPSNVIF